MAFGPSGWVGLIFWRFLAAAGVRAAARPGSSWSARSLKAPVRAPGEDERAGCWRAAADDRERGRAWGWWLLVAGVGGSAGWFPGRAWSAEWSHVHPFGACPGAGAMTVTSGDRAAQSGHRARQGRLMRFCELARGLAAPLGRWPHHAAGGGVARAWGCAARSASARRCQARVRSLRAIAVVAIFLPRRWAMAW